MDLRKIIRSATVFGGATLLSRILGLIRDVVTAQFFGTSFAMSAHTIAFTVPNLFRRIFGEGALVGAFVPVFTEEMHKHGREKGLALASKMTGLLALILLLVTAGMVVALGAVRLCAPLSEKAVLIYSLTQWMFPYVFFICLAALFMGILNSLGHFAVPALSPCLLNLALIFSVLAVCPLIPGDLNAKIYGLAFGVLLGGLLQFAAHLPVLRKNGVRWNGTLDFKDPLIRRIFWLMIPGVLGLSINQLNVLVNRFLSYLISDSAAAILFYSDRLVEFPLGIFGIAFGTAILPALSWHAAKNQIPEFKTALVDSLRQVFFITIPASIGLLVMARPIVQLVFERGEFGPNSTTATAWCLIYYSLGLFAYTGVKIVVPAFYSLKDMKTPVKIGFGCLAFNVALNLILMWPMKERGLALSTALSSMLNLGLLVVLLEKKVGRLDLPRLWSSLIRVSALSLAAAGLSWLFWWKVSSALGMETLRDRLLATGGGIAVAILGYFTLAALLRLPELHELRAAFSRKKTPPPPVEPPERNITLPGE